MEVPAVKRRDQRPRPQKLWEWLLGQQRSAPYLPEPVPFDTPETDQPIVGICCSGGGVRSAAFNLGALQVLKEEGVLDRAHFLTAVSGGAYIAASHAIVANYSSDETLIDQPAVYAPGSPEELYLRTHSSYIAPGLSGKMNALIRLLGGIAVNIVLVAAALFLLARPAAWLYTREIQIGEFGVTCPLQPGLAVQPDVALPPDPFRNPDCPPPPGIGDPQRPNMPIDLNRWPLLTWSPLAAGVLFAFVSLLARMRESVRQFVVAWSRRLVALGLFFVVLVVVIPILVRFVRMVLPELASAPIIDSVLRAFKVPGTAPEEQTSRLLQFLSLLVSSGVVAWVIRWLFSKRWSRLAMAVASVLGPLLVGGLFLSYLNDSTVAGAATMATRGLNPPLSGSDLGYWPAVLLALILSYGVADLTRWSLHPFYKRRLATAYSLRRIQERSGRISSWEIPYDDMLRLSCSQPRTWKPELIVCAAANVTDPGATPPGRNASPFTFSAHSLGGWQIGYEQTTKYEALFGGKAIGDPCDQSAKGNLGQDFTLLAAVAVSGAAFSPSMGKMTRKSLTFLLTLANLRLGVWLPNPRWMDHWEKVASLPSAARKGAVRPRPKYLIKEMLGLNKLDDRFLYVTDGGHYENLGLVELLRRRCTMIYCIDATGGEGDDFSTLGEAVEIARADTSVEIHIDPRDLVPDKESGWSPVGHVLGTVNYLDRKKLGRLVYIRTALTKDAPLNAKTYRRKNPDFPHDPTLDQSFDEEQFEAYRALGEQQTIGAVAQAAKLGLPGSPPPEKVIRVGGEPVVDLVADPPPF